MAKRQGAYPNRTSEEEARIWQLVEELRESQAAATAALNRMIDVQGELWALQGVPQDDINMIFDRKPRNVYFVDMLTRITHLDRLRKWAGLNVR